MEETLLQAIHDNPGDDLARQALADWLEEQGDPRGELLRLHLHVRQRPDSAERAGWEERVAALLAAGVRPCVPILTNSIGMRLALVPAGKFLMGSPDKEKERSDDEGPRHEVEISQAFYLGVFPVTQEQYQKVMGKNPSWFSAKGEGKDEVKGLDTSEFPVEQVSWHDAKKFCKKLSALPQEKEKKRLYRLPTEAEWEYACRGGRAGQPFHFGASLSSTQANFNGNNPYGGADKGPYLVRTCKVGGYPANAFGLHDVHGNVFEWCADWHDTNYYASSPHKDPKGPTTGTARVLRGGSWYVYGWNCRTAFRNGGDPGIRGSSLSFRVLCVAAPRAP
jgi:uncharacterized protein (TIGR02996 family)